MNSLPPDPYKMLGVVKDAKLPDIRTAYKKRVLQCHPDKVQDPALKAEKQDEFQRVQQAYELLTDEKERMRYDDMVMLNELRRAAKNMSNTSTPRTPPRSQPAHYSYEVRNVGPRPDTFSSGGAPQPTTTKFYAAQKGSASYEDDLPGSRYFMHEERHHTSRRTASFEKPKEERRRAAAATTTTSRGLDDWDLGGDRDRGSAERKAEKDRRRDDKRKADKARTRESDERRRHKSQPPYVEPYEELHSAQQAVPPLPRSSDRERGEKGERGERDRDRERKKSTSGSRKQPEPEGRREKAERDRERELARESRDRPSRESMKREAAASSSMPIPMPSKADPYLSNLTAAADYIASARHKNGATGPVPGMPNSPSTLDSMAGAAYPGAHHYATPPQTPPSAPHAPPFGMAADEDVARRSSARASSRRASHNDVNPRSSKEQVPSPMGAAAAGHRKTASGGAATGSSSNPPIVIDAASPPSASAARMPNLKQSHSTSAAEPLPARKLDRSRTMEPGMFSASSASGGGLRPPIPGQIPRASTYHPGTTDASDRDRDRGRGRSRHAAQPAHYSDDEDEYAAARQHRGDRRRSPEAAAPAAAATKRYAYDKSTNRTAPLPADHVYYTRDDAAAAATASPLPHRVSSSGKTRSSGEHKSAAYYEPQTPARGGVAAAVDATSGRPSMPSRSSPYSMSGSKMFPVVQESPRFTEHDVRYSPVAHSGSGGAYPHPQAVRS